jgi:large subunit ribosomal protein L15
MVTLHTLKAPAPLDPPQEARGSRPGLGSRQDGRSWWQGPEGPLGQHAVRRLRRWPEPPSAPAAEVRLHPPNRLAWAIVNLGDLQQFADGASVDQAALKKAGIIKGRFDGIKVLGNGKLTKKLTVKAHKFSGTAKDAITKAGGSVEELALMVHKPEAAAKAHAGKGVKA